MSEHTKKHRTNTKVKTVRRATCSTGSHGATNTSTDHTYSEKHLTSIVFEGPSDKAETAIKTMKKYGYRVKENNELKEDDSVPWREAFSDVKDEEFPGRTLRGARVKEGLTQVELAERSGIPQAHISAMENNKRQIGRKHAKLFGEILNMNYRLFL